MTPHYDDDKRDFTIFIDTLLQESKRVGKPWRASRHKLLNFISSSLQSRRWEHVKRFAKNMNIQTFILAAVCTIFVFGCANSIPLENKPKVAPRVQSKATIYVFDDLGGINLGTGELVMVNGSYVGPLSRREYTWFYMTPGKANLSMNDPALKNRKMSARVFDVEAGKTYYVRYEIDNQSSDRALLVEIVTAAAGNSSTFKPDDLELISESAARNLMAKSRLVGSKNP